MNKHSAEVFTTTEGYRIDWIDVREFNVYLGQTKVNSFSTSELPRYPHEAAEIAAHWWHNGGREDSQYYAQQGEHDR